MAPYVKYWLDAPFKDATPPKASMSHPTGFSGRLIATKAPTIVNESAMGRMKTKKLPAIGGHSQPLARISKKTAPSAGASRDGSTSLMLALSPKNR